MTSNKKITKNLLGAAAIATACLLPLKSLALDSEVKIGGLLEVQGIYYSNSNQLHTQRFSPYRNDFGLLSGGNFFVDYQLVNDNDVKYGAKIGIEHTTRNDNGVPMAFYVESDFGRLEGGSDKAAGGRMRITCYSGAVGSGGGWSSIVNAAPQGVETIAYATDFNGFLDTKSRPAKRVELSRKISYFTPKIPLTEGHSLQFGISYIPDTSNNGRDKTISKDHVFKISGSDQYKFSIKDGFSGGITYEGSISDDLSAKVALVGETGTPQMYDMKSIPISTKFKKVATYSIGTEVKYDKVTLVGSYMNYNKSLTSKSVDILGRDTSVYGIGAKYSVGKYTFGGNQFFSNYKGNKFAASSIGMDYSLATGLKTYVQYVYYNAKGKFIDNNQVLRPDKAHGNVVFVGAKLSV